MTPHLLTFNVIGVVNDKVSVPNYRQVDRQVADVITLIIILKYKTKRTRLKFILIHSTFFLHQKTFHLSMKFFQ